MKFKTIFLMFFLLNCFASTSQSLLVDGAEWHYTLAGGWPFSDIGVNRCFISGDTVIQQKECKIYWRSFGTCDFRDMQDYLYEENDSLFYFDKVNEKFNLLYSYALEEGDTMILEHWFDDLLPDLYDSIFYLRVDSISSVLYDTISLKKFHVSYDLEDASVIEFLDYSKGTIIEQIGSLTTLFHLNEPFLCDGTFNTELRCFSHPEYGTIKFVDYACDSIFTTANKELERNNESISIYPNPCQNRINIYSSELYNNCDLIIYNLDGQRVFRETIALEKGVANAFDVSKLRPSMYVVKLVDLENGSVHLSKLIKQ